MSNSKIGMFLDSEVGMGIWTRHVSDDGKVYYYNMKRNESRWAYEFQEKEQQYIESINDVFNVYIDNEIGSRCTFTYPSILCE